MKTSLKLSLIISSIYLVIFALPIHSQVMGEDIPEQSQVESWDTKGVIQMEEFIPVQSQAQTQETEEPVIPEERAQEQSTATNLSTEGEEEKGAGSTTNWQLIIVIVIPIIIISSLFKIFYNIREDGNTSGAHFKNNSFADIAVNDAAIGNSDHDQLGTSVLAKGLSLFLCNKKTIPPITLAVTGEWGSGKSSVMGMLMGCLKDARYRPIWFNAWHHYKEEHMFGALLETIRQEAVPPVWSPSGLSFRVRLLARRAWRHPMLTILHFFLCLLFCPVLLFK